jgi:predicted Zn-ribbon and HTH transcriptional regulator
VTIVPKECDNCGDIFGSDGTIAVTSCPAGASV